MKSLWTIITHAVLAALVLTLAATLAAGAALACEAPAPVCAWKERVVGIRTPNMIASGTMLADGLIITNRHVVEDHAAVLTRDHTGGLAEATPVPHTVPVDLAMLRLSGTAGEIDEGPDMAEGLPQTVYIVGFDQGRNAPRVYAPSSFAMYPRQDAAPQARIHTNARALPGNSGGAVVDAEGRLVGILASGDGKISEVISASHIRTVIASASPDHRQSFLSTGGAIRRCADALYDAAGITRDPPEDLVSVIETECAASGNRQLFDQAGQTFGRWWMFDRSKAFLKRSLALDPDSPNTLMSMAVTLHLNRESAAERPILERYLAIDPANTQALRMAVQVAGAIGDRDFGYMVLDLMRAHNPAAVPMAESFLAEAFAN